MNKSVFGKKLAVWLIVFNVCVQFPLMGHSETRKNHEDSASLKIADSASSISPNRGISLLPHNSANRVLLLGMGVSGDEDERLMFLKALLRSGDLEKTTHWYVPFQPYGISLLKQFVITGDTFAKVALKGIYFENLAELDTVLTELRALGIAHPEIVKKWIIKTSYPTLMDSERGYTLALKSFFDKPDVPSSVRYQVEALLANAMYSYYDILDDDNEVGDKIGYVDAAFDYYGTFKAFSAAFDSLNTEFKSWLPAEDFVEVSELMGYYKKAIQTNEAENDGLFYYLDSRSEMINSIQRNLTESSKNTILIMAPIQELVVNNQKVGFESILSGLLEAGINKDQIKRLFSFSGSTVFAISFSEDSAFFCELNNDLIAGSVEEDKEEGRFGDYFLFGIKSKDPSDSICRAWLLNFHREYKRIYPDLSEIRNTHISIKVADSDLTGIETYTLLPIDRFSAWDTAIMVDGDIDGSEVWGYDYVDNYAKNDIPKLRHSSAQLEIAYSFMTNQSSRKFVGVLDNLLLGNGLGAVGSSLGYRGIALNLLSSGEKNQAKTYSFWGLRGGEYQSANRYLTGFHFGYLQGSAFALDKKRRFYFNLLTYIEGFDSKLSIPIGSTTGSLSNPLEGKTFKTVGTVYGMMVGSTVRLSRIFVHGNIGYGWDLGSGEWTMNKVVAPGISNFKYTGLNYGLQIGYKFGLLKKENKAEWQLDSVATEGAKTTKTPWLNYRRPSFATGEKTSRVEDSLKVRKDTATGWGWDKGEVELKTPQGYHYDFNDAELSAEAAKLLVNRAKLARIVLSGENHRYVKFNSMSEYRWMKLLYEQAGYRNYIQELSPTRALFLERYICKGDTQAKKFVQATASARYMVLFDSLAAWQMSLPESERIRIFGLDVERFPDMTVMWLNDIVTRRMQVLGGGKLGGWKSVPTAILPGVKAVNYLGSLFYYNGLRDFEESLIEFNEEQSSDTISISKDTVVALEIEKVDDWRQLDYRRINFNETQSVSELYHYLDSNLEAFKVWMGPGWNEFFEAFARLKEVYEWERRDDLAQQYQWREEAMFRNMVKLLEKYPTNKYFGQFGRCHISLSKQQQDCGWFEYNSILSRLKNRYFKNDTFLMNIGIFYKENEDDIDDISSSDLLHNSKIQQEVSTLYEATEENTMLYDLNQPNSNTSELRKKFNFVVIVGKEQNEDDNEFSFSMEDSDSYEGNSSSTVNMGVYFGYSYGASAGKLLGNTLSSYLFDQLNAEVQNKSINSHNSFLMGYRSKHVSMQYQMCFMSNQNYIDNGSSKLDGNLVMHGLTMYLHNQNTFNKKFIHYGIGMGYTFAKQTLTYNEIQTQLNLVKDPVALVNYRGMPTASVVLGIMKDNVGLDIEAGYRLQTQTSTWEYRGSRLPFATPTYINGLQDELLSLPFATFNLRIIIPNTQPVYTVKDKNSNSSESFVD